MFNVNGAIASALAKGRKSKFTRGNELPRESKCPVIDPSVDYPPHHKSRCGTEDCTEPKNQKLLMESESRGDDQKGDLLTDKSKGIPAQESPKRSLGCPVKELVERPPSTCSVERPVTSQWKGKEMGLGKYAEDDIREIREFKKAVRKWNPKSKEIRLILEMLMLSMKVSEYDGSYGAPKNQESKGKEENEKRTILR